MTDRAREMLSSVSFSLVLELSNGSRKAEDNVNLSSSKVPVGLGSLDSEKSGCSRVLSWSNSYRAILRVRWLSTGAHFLAADQIIRVRLCSVHGMQQWSNQKA
ncbi:hypothetical protein RJ55_04782 [Drechmeria coniospora]|nr:hypothetical protein RJ55_04782 [Drechmeria coniospora]